IAEVFLEFPLLVLEGVGVRRRGSFDRNVRPDFRELGVDLQPLAVRLVLAVRLDRIDRAFRFADATINALVRMDDEEVLALIEAVDRADLDAVHVFAAHACVGDDVGHWPKFRLSAEMTRAAANVKRTPLRQVRYRASALQPRAHGGRRALPL